MSPKLFEWSDGKRREPLPIDDHLPEILSALRENRVIVCEAETGAGKTTRIPQAILLEMPEERVWMTQTRRPAVRWNGKRIAWEMGESPGGIVGWRLRGDPPVVSDRTCLTLVVDQSLANRIRREGRLPRGVLIIDEAHERSVSTDLLLGLIKQYLPTAPRTRVVITSATIDTAKFSAYFDGAPVVSVLGRCFSVETQVEDLTYAEHHTSGAIRAAEAVMEQFVFGELTTVKADGGEERQIVRSGSILILLPGKDDIKEAMKTLARKAEELRIADRVEVLPCHGQISGSEQDAVQKRVPQGTLRFVAATEIVRSSVTVPQTLGVIDSLQVKRLLTDAKGVAHLKKVAVSKAEADQGKGRAGRTQPGFYIPISYRGEYDRLVQWPKPAILREPIASVVLQVAAVDLNVRTFPFIDRPAEDKIDVAIERLIKLGALDAEEAITERGRLLVRFPVDPERAQVLVKANELGVLAEAIVAAAVLENEGIFHRPKERGSKVLVDEGILRGIIAAGSSSRYFDDDGERTWRNPRPEEVDLSDLPDWVTPTKGGRCEVDCGDWNFPNREGARWVADRVWREFAAGTGSDYVAAVRAFRAFKAEEYRLRDLAREYRSGEDGRNGGFGRHWQENQLRQWCFDHFLNYKKLRVVQRTVEQLREEVASSPLALENRLYEEREFDAEALTKALASGLVDQVCRHSSGRSYDGPMGSGIQVSYSSACQAESGLILIGGVRKIPTRSRRGGTSFILLADMAAPIEAEWLVEIMPQLCESKLRDGSAWYDAETGTVRGTEDSFYGNVLISYREVQVTGEVGVEALANALIGESTGHPAEAANRAFRNEVAELHIRSGAKLGKIDPGKLTEWYVSKLGEVYTLAEAQELDLDLTNADISQLLGIEDYVAERVRIRRERPDSWTIADETYNLAYKWSWGFKGVEIWLPIVVIAELKLADLPQCEGVQVRVYVANDDYSSLYVTLPDRSLEELRGKIESLRQDLAWKAFKADGHGDYDHKVEVPYEAPLLKLPAPEVWDPVTGSLAYPGLVHYSTKTGEEAVTIWCLRWFRTEEEAQKAQAEALAKKAEKDAEEYERRNFEVLKAEAQTLYEVVKRLWGEIDTEKYQAYGLSKEEVGSRYSTGEIPRKLEEAERLAFGSSGYYSSSKPQPTKALEALRILKERLGQALAHFAENAEREPEAKVALEAAQALATQVEGLYDEDWVDWSTRGEVQDAVRAAVRTYENCQYVEAVEKAQAAAGKAEAIIAEVEAKRAARQLLQELLARDYATCPVCGEELNLSEDGQYHTCRENQEALVARGQGKEFDVKTSRIGDQTVVRLEAVPYSDYEHDLYLRINEDVIITDLGEVETETLWREPSGRERELATEIGRLQAQLSAIEDERSRSGRVEGTFSEVLHRGKPQLQFEGTFTGSVENRKATDGSGYSSYDNQPAKFVCKHNCYWLDEEPKVGERWICTTAFQIAFSGGRVVIVVNPQVRVGDEAQIRAEIACLEAELAAEAVKVEPFDENDEANTVMAAAFREAGLA